MENVLNYSWVVSGIVAVVQIALASFLVDRYVKRIQLRSEQRKWQAARNELGASLLYFAYSICGPVVHYTTRVDGKIRPRRNIGASFSHIESKSRDFNALLAIYANTIPVKWYAKIVSSSFEIQAAANNARIALNSWEEIRGYAEGGKFRGSLKLEFSESDVKTITGTDSYPVPEQSPDREVICFIYDYYHSLSNTSEAARKFLSIAELVAGEMQTEKLNNTEIFNKLNSISKGRSEPFTASYFRKTAQIWVKELDGYKDSMRNSGILLRACSEFD